MPSLELFVDKVPFAGADDGDLVLDPSAMPLRRVPLRRLSCQLRVPRVPGAYQAFIDTGAPLSLIPHRLWAGQFNWREGRDFDILPVAGNPPLPGQLLSHRYAFRLARLRVPVILAGKDLAGSRLQVDSLVAQLAEPNGPPFVLLGLWGGVFDARRLSLNPTPDGDLSASLACD